MRITILNVHAPYVSGGAEQLANSLLEALQDKGHDVALIRIPFLWAPTKNLLKSMAAARMLPIEGGNPDLVIGLKFPAYLAPHPNKKLWLIHQHRQVYDLWGTDYQDLPNTEEGRRIRSVVIKADTQALQQMKSIYTISHNVARRLKSYNGIDATGVLYPPLPMPHVYRQGDFDDYFVYLSRITPLKRQILAITAMRYVRLDFKLLIAGQVDVPKYKGFLDTVVAGYKLEDRVRFLGPVSHDDKLALLANATGVVYTPFDEDYGYVTLEALQSGKPVITCHDAGGVTEFVEDKVNGYVVASEAQQIAAAMDQLFADKQRSKEMGEAGRELLSTRNIGWSTVLESLLA
jgi:glycosyltransferase involved in cell wall biosynthesis